MITLTNTYQYFFIIFFALLNSENELRRKLELKQTPALKSVVALATLRNAMCSCRSQWSSGSVPYRYCSA